MGEFVSEKRWFFISMLVGLVMLLLPLPEGLSKEGLAVLATTVVATMLFITGK